MRLVMTLLVRDEVDVIEANIAYHLAAGVDMIVATDNGSTDGTAEILERYERTRRLRLIHEPNLTMQQFAWVTRMARIAATELGAHWVMHNDADQFWWPRRGSLKAVFASVPDQYGVLVAPKLNFVATSDDAAGGSFDERLTVRRTLGELQPGHRLPRGTSVAVAHRADPDVQVVQGNHGVRDTRLRRLPNWYPIVLLHFPERSYESFESKVRTSGSAYARGAEGIPERAGSHYRRLYEVWRRGGLEQEWSARMVRPDELRERIGRGELVEDHRLRDRLAELRSPNGFAVPPPPTAPEVQRGDLARELDAAIAAERRQTRERESQRADKALRRRAKELEQTRSDPGRPGLRRALVRAVERLRPASKR
jgi:hypothetical protein